MTNDISILMTFKNIFLEKVKSTNIIVVAKN